MLSEQQQRIMGYFIEEAKDHLNTIEQGLLNLQATIADPEMVSEVFRAAHSVKGGAAMLGLDSIQQTAHRLEDYFKVLKECPVQVDQTLETMFLRVFDSLQELLEQLQGPFGLTADKASAVMAEVEPVFVQLNQHLSNLVSQSGRTPPEDVQLMPPTAAPIPASQTPVTAFQREVPARLRDMLQQFKQADTAATRQQLQEICQSLYQLGEQFSLPQWSGVLELAQQAIAHPDNSYRTLAPILIKDIKQAYELALAERVSEIQPSIDLQAIVPVSAEPDLFDLLTPDEADLSTSLFDFDPLVELTADEVLSPVSEAATEDDWFADAAEAMFAADADAESASTANFDEIIGPRREYGPEVGLAELNSLADLFEGELPDLSLGWQAEAIGDANGETEALDLDSSSDFSDLLFGDPEATNIVTDDEDLSGLLNSTEANIPSTLEDLPLDFLEDPLAEPEEELPLDLLEDPLAELDLSDLAFTDAIAPAENGASTKADSIADSALGDLNGLFANLQAEEAAVLETDVAAFDDLDTLFGEDVENSVTANPESDSPFDDAFAALTLEASSSPASSDDFNDLNLSDLNLDDPFTFTAPASEGSDDFDVNTDLFGSLDAAIDEEAINSPEPLAEAAFSPNEEITSDLWDSVESEPSSLEVAGLNFDDPFALSTAPPAVSPIADEPVPPTVTAIDELLLDFEIPTEASDGLNAATSDELLLDFDGSASTSLEAEMSELPDLNDWLGDSLAESEDQPEADPLASDELVLPLNVESIETSTLETEANSIDDLDALFGTVEPDMLTADSLEDEAEFEELLGSPASGDPEMGEFDLWGLAEQPEDSTSTDTAADLLDLMVDAPADAVPLLDFTEADPTTPVTDALADFGLDLDGAIPAVSEASSTNEDASAEDSPRSLDDIQFDSLWEETPNQTAATAFDESIAPEIPELSLELDAINLDSAAPSPELEFTLEPVASDDPLNAIDLADLEEADSAEVESLFDFDSPLVEDAGDDLDMDAIAALTEEISPFDLESLTLGSDDRSDLLAAEPEAEANFFDPEALDPDAIDLEGIAFEDDSNLVFDLDELVPDPGEAIELPATPLSEAAAEDALDLLLASGDTGEAIDVWGGLVEVPADDSETPALDDLDTLLGQDADDTSLVADFDSLLTDSSADALFEVNESIELDDFGMTFTAESEALQPTELTDSLDDLLAPVPDNEADFDALLNDEAVTSAEANLAEAADMLFSQPAADVTFAEDDFDDLETLLGDTALAPEGPLDDNIAANGFADLEALLEPEVEVSIESDFNQNEDADEEFANLDALLSDEPAAALTNEFDDLEKLLENADQTLGGSPTDRGVRRSPLMPKKRSPGVLKDQNMRVSVKNLDNLNNLVGELVVNRNSLEQTQERVRQFLDNLVYQVQQLSDVGQRMRDLYERSLLESSLLSSRRSYQLSSQGSSPTQPAANHSTGMSFDALEMDRFTGFHTLSQEMIELIVRVRESASDIDRMVDESDQITRMFRQVTTQLQEGLTRSRMVPFDQTAARLPRAVRDISLKCGKQAELVVEGKETLIDKMILEQLYDPMTHLVNNAITHGIETPAQRQAAGKPPTGRITIRAFHQGNQTVISVTDDGAGIDPDTVKRKAIEKRLITPAEANEMTRLDVYDLLFLHGFSTRDRADDFAGRGVGMDVVRTSLNEVRGTINIDSTVGRGTTFTIRLPLTLSISKALCCISNRARIAFPMDGVEDMFDVPKEQIQTDAEGRSCIQWRDLLLPFQPLAELLRYSRSLGRGSVYGGHQEDDIISVVILRSNAGSFLALQVDQVLGEQEIVIKQLEGPVPKPVGVAGATVLGDGHIMPIADVLELIDLSQGRIRREPGSSLWEKADGQVPLETTAVKTDPTVLIVDDSITVRELLSMTFNKIGYRVEQARDGQEAWEKLRAGLPCDLVFCDIEMPRMDGLELLSRIQKDPHLSHLPIAMLTSRGADRHRQMAVQLGAKGYFTKPYLEESLLDAAQRMLKGEVLVNL